MISPRRFITVCPGRINQRNTLHCNQTEGSLPCSLQLATGPCPQPDDCCPQPVHLYIFSHLLLILTSGLFPCGSLHLQQLHMHLSSVPWTRRKATHESSYVTKRVSSASRKMQATRTAEFCRLFKRRGLALASSSICFLLIQKSVLTNKFSMPLHEIVQHFARRFCEDGIVVLISDG